ncbi:hypothetical protein G9F71_000760 [Clostridium sp. FP2]|uniref:hypothetical protein n=1 Tax=Clostridium sp. FP2 TaxID=2724481 RepID=UPI0013E98602|nr:hypothetical protein [Clostridium sp. FP2]MBZ9621422.1 hypothetical protein [Clostridium sp. FP2]
MKKANGKLVRDIDYVNNLIGQSIYAEDINNKELKKQSKSALVSNKINIYKLGLLSLNSDGDTYNYILHNIKKIAEKNTLKVVGVCDDWKSAELILQSIDLRLILNVKILLKQTFKSDLFPNEKLYINQIKDAEFNCTKYRLFFKKEKVRSSNEDGEPDKFENSYSILDLYMMIFQKKYYEAMEDLTKMFEIKMRILKIENKFRDNQKKKIERNLIALNDLKDYPNLYGYISKYIMVLRELNFKSNKHVMSISKSYEQQCVFYTTVRTFEVELAEIVKELMQRGENLNVISYSTISRLFQLYRVFGLLIVVPDDKVPKEYKDNAPQKINSMYNDFIYFTIPSYNKTTLANAERIAKKLAKAGFVISKMRRETIQGIMGKVFSDNIYCASVARYERSVINAKKEGVDAPQEFGRKRHRSGDDKMPF